MKKHVTIGLIGLISVGVLMSLVYSPVKGEGTQASTELTPASTVVLEENLNTDGENQEILEISNEDVKYGHVKLDINNVRWDIHRPSPHNEGGFCGETTIQMGALYYGMYFPQMVTHDAGTPEKIDLHAADISLAMTKINMNFDKYMDDFGDNEDPNKEGLYNGYDVYFDWMREQLDNNTPVFVGVKRSPDIHPNWFVDHFVLLIGYSDSTFQFNSNTEEGQIKFTYDILTDNKHRGYTFKNHNNRRFAYSITGMEYTKDSIPVRLNLQEFKSFEEVVVEGRIDALDDTKSYSLLRYDTYEKIKGIEDYSLGNLIDVADQSLIIQSEDGLFKFEETLNREDVYMYYCIEN